MANRRKPHDPAKAALATQERKDRDTEAQRLQDQGATVKRDKAGHIISAYRSNFANLLLSRGTITQSHHDAASQLAEVWAIWKGLDGKQDGNAEFVDNGRTPPDQRCLVSDRQVRAGKDVAWTLDQLDRTHGKILCAFMVATVEEDRPMDWRGIVERETAITVRERQTQLVVGALEELRRVYQEPRERAA